MINLTIVWQPGPLHVLETGEQSGDKTCKIMQYWELVTWQSTSGQTSLSAKNAGSEGESRAQPLRNCDCGDCGVSAPSSSDDQHI